MVREDRRRRGSIGVAGRSASEVYRSERARARRRRVEHVVWVAVAVGAAVVVASHRSSTAPVVGLAVVGLAAVGLAAVGLAAVGLAAVGAAVLRRPRPDPERWWRGAEGERATGDLLDELPRRWSVLHDLRVPGSRANIDHLVIGPRGVWVIDTKAYRGAPRARWRSITVAGRPLDTSASAWEAEVVADRLGVEVRPLVVLHGRGLPSRGRRCDGVRVVPAAALLRRIRRERVGPHIGAPRRRALFERALTELPEA